MKPEVVLLILVLAVRASAQASYCKSYVCSGEVSCISETDDSVFLNPQHCGSGHECFLAETKSEAICRRKIDRTDPMLLYPGYTCRGRNVEGTCAFGKKICASDDVCEGVPLHGECSRSADCYWGLYCGLHGRCLQLNKENERCSTFDSCEYGTLCYYTSPEEIYGTCVRVRSKDNEELVLPLKDRSPIPQSGVEKLCRNGVVNETSGRCSRSIISKNKGQTCETDADCPTSDAEVFAKCRCGYSSRGQKYCDIEAGDDEWVKANDMFKAYVEDNQNCHTAEHFGSCAPRGRFYRDWKCAEMRARYFVDLIDNPSCLREMYAVHPHFSEYHRFCGAWRALLHWTFVGLAIGAMLVI